MPRVAVETEVILTGLDQTPQSDWPSCMEMRMKRQEHLLDLDELQLGNILDCTGETSDPREIMLPTRRDASQQTVSGSKQEPSTCSSRRTMTTPSPISGNKPIRHRSTERKIKQWNLLITRKHLIIGDSNVAKFPAHTYPDLQIDSFPAATFRHIHGILEKLQPAPSVETVILSLGINNRKQKTLTAVKEAQRLYKRASIIFPNASILFPIINFSRTLPFKEQEVLQGINRHLKSKYRTLLELPRVDFVTERDMVHWTTDTATRLLEHWIQQGN